MGEMILSAPNYINTALPPHLFSEGRKNGNGDNICQTMDVHVSNTHLTFTNILHAPTTLTLNKNIQGVPRDIYFSLYERIEKKKNQEENVL